MSSKRKTTYERRETTVLPGGATVASRNGQALLFANRTQAERCLSVFHAAGVGAWIWQPGRVFYVRIVTKEERRPE